MSLVDDEMWMAWVTIAWFEFESLILESDEILGRFLPILDDEPCHGTTAAFGIDRDRLEFAILHYKKLRMDDRHLLANPLPIEQVLHLFGGQMHEDAIVSLHRFYQQVGKQWFPMLEHGLAVQFHLALHPIWMYPVKRT